MKRTSGSRRENKRKEDRARARAGLPRSKEEEKKRRDWQRRSGQNWGRPIFLVQEMKEAEVNPVPSKAFKVDYHPAVEVERLRGLQKERREARKERGAAAERDFDQVKNIIQSSARGLQETCYLELRIQLLRRSNNKDRQSITTSLLAKTLAFKGELEEAKAEMGKWGSMTCLGGQEEEKKVERRRWREASSRLNLFLSLRDGSEN